MDNTSNLRRWLYLALTSLALVPLLLVGAILAWHSLITQQRHVLSMQTNQSQYAVDEILAAVNEVKNDLSTSLLLTNFTVLDQPQLESVLSTLLMTTDRHDRNIIDELILLDHQGTPLARSSRTKIFTASDLDEPTNRAEFIFALKNNAAYYSEVNFEKKTGDPLMSVGIPISSLRAQRIDAVLVAKLRLKELWDLVATLPIGETGIAYLTTANGRIVAHPNPSTVLRGQTFLPPQDNGLHQGFVGSWGIITHQPLQLGNQPFVIVTELPIEEALYPTLQSIAVITLCIALAIVASGLLGYLIIRRIIRPLATVTNAAIAISDGDYSQAPIALPRFSNADEIGRLASSFNLMAKRIQLREQDLKYAIQEAEAAAKVKSDFLATMSHEIRTPMNGIMGFTQLLQHSKLDETQQEYLHLIDQSGKSLLALLNDILDFSSAEAERLTLQSIAFDPRECINAAINVMRGEAERKHLRLTLNYPADNHTRLIGDAGRLRQVLINLISNAVKFCHFGKITIDASLSTQDDERASLYIQVIDSGIGIDEATQQIIFEPFTQGDNSSTRQYGGTGLGLAICKRLINQMGGEIGVSSQPGQGSLFWIALTLPIAPTAPATTADEHLADTDDTEQQGLSQYRGQVLLVEDDPTCQLYAQMLLEHLGFRVFIANNGNEAMEQLQQRNYDLIFMDCQMPEMDGYQATRLIRRQGNQVPIIAVTAHAMPCDRQRCLETGMSDYIAKPFSKRALLSVLMRWLPIEESIS